MVKNDLTHWQLHTAHTQDWAWYSNVFTDQELDAIITLGETHELAEGVMFNPDDPNLASSMRQSKISWITPNSPDAEWLFRKLTDVIIRANEDYFQFDISEIEHLQYTVYDRKNDHYDWHRDMLPQMPGRNIRKLSFSLLLDDPKDYKGGDLELMLSAKPVVPESERGKMIFFPGYAVHRVTSVIKGKRRSLVGWVKGPGWK
jgi:predicted 2-oxoglutarate/Fe(II)-dependent dioxygenase YbiX